MKKLSALVLMFLLTAFVAVPIGAQDTGTTTGTYEERGDDGMDLGWLGLLGLAGLLGLKRREREPYRDTTRAPVTGTTTTR